MEKCSRQFKKPYGSVKNSSIYTKKNVMPS